MNPLLVKPRDHRSRPGQAGIRRLGCARDRRARWPGRREAKKGVVGQLPGPAPGPLGEVSFLHRLQAPQDPAHQSLPVSRRGRFTEELGVTAAQFGHAHRLQFRDTSAVGSANSARRTATRVQ